MRIETITKELYQFEELSDKAKQNAIDQMYDINVSHEWWDFTYEDAKRIECTIDGFDLDRGYSCNLSIDCSAKDTAKLILIEHGPKSDTYQLAEKYLVEYELITFLHELYSDLWNDTPVNQDLANDLADEHLSNTMNHYSDLIEGHNSEFLNDIRNEYISILIREYEYLTSEDAIIETIEANEYEFDLDGQF